MRHGSGTTAPIHSGNWVSAQVASPQSLILSPAAYRILRLKFRATTTSAVTFVGEATRPLSSVADHDGKFLPERADHPGNVVGQNCGRAESLPRIPSFGNRQPGLLDSVLQCLLCFGRAIP